MIIDKGFHSRREKLTYQELFVLKFKQGVSTHELVRLFPKEVQRVSEVALLEIPENTLKEIVREEKAFNRLMRLKRKFSRFF